MKHLFERRASTILYNVFKSRRDQRPILIPANVCASIPLVLRKAGQPFEVVDISGADLCINKELVLSRLGDSRKAAGGVLFVHTYGALSDTTEFYREIKTVAPTSLIIDDRCLAPPVLEPVSNGADMTVYSTGERKYLSLGSGGFAWMVDSLPYERHLDHCRCATDTSLERQVSDAIARREPFTHFESDWLVGDLPDESWNQFAERVERELPGVLAHKSRLNSVYWNTIPGEAQLSAPYHVWRFQVRVHQARRLLESLFEASLFASNHYRSISPSFGGEETPIADRLAGEVVNLFNDLHFSESQAAMAADLVARHVYRYGVPEETWIIER